MCQSKSTTTSIEVENCVNRSRKLRQSKSKSMQIEVETMQIVVEITLN